MIKYKYYNVSAQGRKLLKNVLAEICETLSNIVIHCLMSVKNPVSYKYTYLTAAYNMREKKENRGV